MLHKILKQREEAGISNVSAFFSVEDPKELKHWSNDFKDVSSKSYMRGYRDICPSLSWFHKLMIYFCDRLVKMRIVKITFKEKHA